MAKIKIYELAKEMNKHSKDIISYLNEKGLEVKSHMSNIDDSSIAMVKNHFGTQKHVEKQSVSDTVAKTESFHKQTSGDRTGGSYTSQNRSNTNQTGGYNKRPMSGQPTRDGQNNHYQQRQTGEGQNSYSMQEKQTEDNQNQLNQENKPQGDGSNRYQGNRPQGDGSNRYQGNRPQGDGSNRYQGNRPQGDGSNRYQGNRPQGDGSNRYQGNRPQGDGSNRYQGNRPQGDGSNRYQGNRPEGDGSNRYQGNRPQGDGSNRYQGNRPQGDGSNRYQGNRPQGDGSNRYQGNRPQGDGSNRYQGNRPQGEGSYNRSNSSYGQNRPAGQSYNQGQGGQYGQNRSQGGYQGNNAGGTGRPAGQYGQGNGQYRNNNNNRPGFDGQRQQGGGQGRTGSYNNGDRNNTQRPYNNSGQNRTGQYGGGGYNNRPSGQGGPNYDRYGGPNKDKDDVSDVRKRSTSSRNDSSAKKFDAPIGMSRSESAGNRNNRGNKNVKNTKPNYSKNYGNESDEIKIPKKGQFIKPKPVQNAQAKEDEIKTIILPDILTIKELADKMKFPAATLVKKLFLAGKMVSINQEITFEEAEEIAIEYEIIAEHEVKVDVIEELLKEEDELEDTLEKRPPVVCVMGHVDHGKTSLLDAIRESNVTSREAGGITQHIGAYVVEVNGEEITFLDTPGHEAFTSMRMRGAKSTDIAILVVAADDGVMPQTVEAISHAKAAGIQIIVAINKVDKPSANIEKVKQELTEYELVAEDWGGDTIFVPVSAHTKEGIEQLLEMIVLTAELNELKANPNRKARGIVIEAELDKGRGPVATILVQKGTLHVGDSIAIGSAYGKVRAMMDDKGRRVKEATPSTPVEILGLNEVPDAGEIFIATDNEKEARTIAETYISQGREKLLSDTKAKLSLDGLFSQIKAGNVKDLNIIIKADVQGSVEAMKQSLLKLSNEEVAVRIIHGGVGAINESDVNLASASNAIIIGFNVRPDNVAKDRADTEKVDLRLYRVIYNAIEDVEAAMKGMLEPIFEEKVIGHAEVRQVFKASGLGVIAGSYVLDGKIVRGSLARITREGTQIFEGTLASLKRFKDDVKEVASGYECGLVFEKFNDLKEFDIVELYIMQEVPR
ncbi:MAG: translation initiation factor IF-2 [Anaerocolumna sp.]